MSDINKIIEDMKNHYNKFTSLSDANEQHNAYIEFLSSLTNLSKTITSEMPEIFAMKIFSETALCEYIKEKQNQISDKMYDLLDYLKENKYNESNPLKGKNTEQIFYNLTNNHFYICVCKDDRKYIIFEEFNFNPYRYYPDLPLEEQEKYFHWYNATEDAKYLTLFSDNVNGNKLVHRPNLEYFKKELEKESLFLNFKAKALIGTLVVTTILQNYREVHLYFEIVEDIFKMISNKKQETSA